MCFHDPMTASRALIAMIAGLVYWVRILLESFCFLGRTLQGYSPEEARIQVWDDVEFVQSNPVTILSHLIVAWQLSFYVFRILGYIAIRARLAVIGSWKHIVAQWRRAKAFKRDLIGFVPEKSVPGSDFEPVKEHHPCAAMIFGTYEVGDAPTYRGMGFRMDDFFVTATHVIEDLAEVWLQTKTGRISVDPSIFVQKESDVAYCIMGKGFVNLGLTKFKVCSPGVGLGAVHYVSVRAKQQALETKGMIRPSDDLCYVSYNGSTTYGFSGAPYVSNKAIYGMHVGSYNSNIGVDATYIRTLISCGKEAAHFTTDQKLNGWLMADEVKGKMLQDGGFAVTTAKGFRFVPDEEYRALLTKKQQLAADRAGEYFTRKDYAWGDAVEECDPDCDRLQGTGDSNYRQYGNFDLEAERRPRYRPECEPKREELAPSKDEALNSSGSSTPVTKTPAAASPVTQPTGLSGEPAIRPVKPPKRKTLNLTLPSDRLSDIKMMELTALLESIAAQQKGVSQGMDRSLQRSINALRTLQTQRSPVLLTAGPQCFPELGSQKTT
uniref:Serine protease n=1 Tax=Riboviria sp. TaxID=2585031 RepID=A0A8K1U4E8_9VIRU|nr:MAG: hypothetical protein 2 [Riboviria sp.]